MKVKKNIPLTLLLIICITSVLFAQKPANPFAHTYSIVARDSNTGEMAVAVQSHWFSVGSIVSWGQSGVGVVATQSFVLPSYGPEGLKLMEGGQDATSALNKLLAADEGQAVRQVAFLDINGNTAAHTGESCIRYASHHHEDNFSVQANMMLTDQVVPAMTKAFKEHAHLPLAERMVAVLEAAENTGGDIRGRQSAALIVVGPDKTNKPWEDHKVNLRVDDHENPVNELKRLLKVHRAYEHMNNGDVAVEHQDMAQALKEYAAAEALFPDNLEMKYWKAIALASNSRLGESLPIFREVFKQDKNWRELTRRLPEANLLNLKERDLNRILETK